MVETQPGLPEKDCSGPGNSPESLLAGLHKIKALTRQRKQLYSAEQSQLQSGKQLAKWLVSNWIII